MAFSNVGVILVAVKRAKLPSRDVLAYRLEMGRSDAYLNTQQAHKHMGPLASTKLPPISLQ